MRRSRVLAVVAAGMVMLATGCGGSTTAISAKANHQLRLDVLAVTESLRGRVPTVAIFTTDTAAALRAAEIDAAATKVADGLDGLAPATAQTAPPKPSTSSTTSSRTSTPTPVEKTKGKGKGHGRG